MNTPPSDLVSRVKNALQARRPLLAEPHNAALRLFNGFYEGCPNLTVDLYARTLLLCAPQTLAGELQAVQTALLAELPWVDCVLQKIRGATDPHQRRGTLTFGSAPAEQVLENGIWYALDLCMNQDASFYLDTRGLRTWLKTHCAGLSVLNTFAYTGSLGVAALGGGARQVVQVDLSRKFLSLALRSCQLNGLDANRMQFRYEDFFKTIGDLKRSGQLFDGVIVDPPFFSSTPHGTVNLVDQGLRVINKLRPLVKDGGWLISINNALFLSGVDTVQSLQSLGVEGYVTLEERIDVPPDFTGYPQTLCGRPPADPAPYNHPTKISVLRIRRKA